MKQSITENTSSTFSSHHWRSLAGRYLKYTKLGSPELYLAFIPSWKLIPAPVTTFTYQNNLQHFIICSPSEHVEKNTIILASSYFESMIIIIINIKKWRIVFKASQRDVWYTTTFVNCQIPALWTPHNLFFFKAVNNLLTVTLHWLFIRWSPWYNWFVFMADNHLHNLKSMSLLIFKT